LEQAFVLMKGRQDTIGQVLAISSIVESHYLESNDLRPLDKWIAELESLLMPDLVFPSLDVEVRALCGMLIAALSRQPQHPMLAVCAERLMNVLSENLDTNQVVTAGTFLLHYYSLSYDIEKSARVVTQIQPLLACSNLAPITQVLWLLRHASYCAFIGDMDGLAKSHNHAQAVIRKEDLHFLKPIAYIQQLVSATDSRDCPDLQSLVVSLQHQVNPERRIDVALILYGKARIEAQQSQMEAALRNARIALHVATESGAVTVQALCRCLLASVLYEQGEVEAARGYLQQTRAGLPRAAARYLHYFSQLLDAHSALTKANPGLANKLLRSAFAIARQEGYVTTMLWPRLAGRLLGFALLHGIEVDYVRRTIKSCDLKCTSPEIENWPWPIKIYSLGRFAVVVDEIPLRASGKTQRKPLDLLKSLIALGGREVSSSAIIRSLWPNSEGDAGQTTFDSNVHRLRKLLGRDDAVLVNDGRVTLNAQIVWVDVWAFERLLGKAETGAKPHTDDGILTSSETAAAAFRLYQGHFLGQEEERPWMFAMREKLRSKWSRHLLVLGRHWEASGEWDKAAELYQRGLELDTLAEDLYRRLMTIYQRRGQYASALEVYRRCRQMLSVVLGVRPSAETEALCQSVRKEN
jgi:DNA-binding SARP family transcriptional activator